MATDVYGHLSFTVGRELTEDSRRIIEKSFPARGEAQGNDIPSWVTGVSATFASPVFNRESPALLEARARVAAAVLRQGTCEVVVAADSKSSFFQGVVVPWPEQLRRMLAARDGFVPADTGALDPRWSSVGMTATGRPTIGLRPETPGSTSTKSVTFTATERFSGGVLPVRITGGGTATLTIDGTAQQVTVPAVTGWHLVDLGALTTTAPVVTIASTGDLYVSGIVCMYDEPALRISNAARGSSTAADWSTTDPAGRWSTVLDGPATSPDVIFSALGTNDITDLASITAYYDKLSTLDVPVIIVSPGGLGGARSRTDAQALENHLYGIAQAHDWPLVDAERVIGTYADAEAHALMLDALHENTRGAALVALAIFALLFG